MTSKLDNGMGPGTSRRRFMTGVAGAAATGIAASQAARGQTAPGDNAGSAAAAEQARAGLLPEDKRELTLLGDRPLNAEATPTLLDGEVTSKEHFFVRNNGVPPSVDEAMLAGWTLTVDGEVDRPLTLSLDQLKSDYDPVTLRIVIECAGNGRRFFQPGASGNQWSFGGVGCADWTGVRLADILERAGVKPSAVYTGHYGADMHLSGDPDKNPISRGIPIAKALEPHTLVAWEMNGEPLPSHHGYPLRLVVPGLPGSCSQKWLNRIWVRDQVHDGEKMQGTSYRVPAYPVPPGAEVPDEDMQIIEHMPVKSLITFPETGARVERGQPIVVRGNAWSGDDAVETVDLSIDFGATWQRAKLGPLKNRYAWRQFTAEIAPPIPGYYEVWARATDAAGNSQPAFTPGWNPKGYSNNMQHRIAVYVL